MSQLDSQRDVRTLVPSFEGERKEFSEITIKIHNGPVELFTTSWKHLRKFQLNKHHSLLR